MNNNKIIKSIIFIILFNTWMLFLWGSDIIVFDNIFEADYYWYVWPITIISHIVTVAGWFLLSKCKGINRNIFVCFTALFSLLLVRFNIYVLTDPRFKFGLSAYIVSLIDSIVPVTIMIISTIILIKSVINKIQQNSDIKR